jgi:uncharacterized protein
MDVNLKSKDVNYKAKVCDDFFSKLRGLMFSKKLGKGECIILSNDHESRINSSIHMLFVFFSLDVIFLDSEKKVVDIRRAKPFVSLITPRRRAQHVVEMNAWENRLKIGDKVSF